MSKAGSRHLMPFVGSPAEERFGSLPCVTCADAGVNRKATYVVITEYRTLTGLHWMYCGFCDVHAPSGEEED